MKLRQIHFYFIIIVIFCFYVIDYFYLQKGILDFYVEPNTSSIWAFNNVAILKSFDFNIFHFGITQSTFPYYDYPPLCSAVMSNLLYLVGSYSLSVLILNCAYLVILIYFTYKLGKELKNSLYGLLGVVFMLLYPHTNFVFDMYSIDLPLMSMVAMSVYFFIKSKYFEITKYTFMFALSCVIGFFAKNTFGAFIVGLVIFGTYKAFYDLAYEKRYTKSLNLLVFGVILCALLFNIYSPLARIKEIVLEESNIGQRINNISTTGLWEYQLTPPFFLLFIFGLYRFIVEENAGVIIVLLSWIVIPNLIVSLMPHWKSVRYVLPSHPAIALISAYGVFWLIAKIKVNKILTAILLIGFIIAGIYQIIYLTYLNQSHSISILGIKYYSRDYNSCLAINKRQGNSFYLSEVMAIIKRLNTANVSIFINSGHDNFAIIILIKYAEYLGINMSVNYPSLLESKNVSSSLESVDLVIGKSELGEKKQEEIISFHDITEQYIQYFVQADDRYKDNEKNQQFKKNELIWNDFIKKLTLVATIQNKNYKQVVYVFKNNR